MDYREPTEDDVPSLISMVKSVYRDMPNSMWYDHRPSEEELTEMFADKLALLKSGGAADIIAVDGDNAVGECEIIKGEEGVGLVGLIIKEEYRSKGIGREILLMASIRAKMIGIRRLRVEVFEANERAKVFFRRMGYSDVPGEGRVAQEKKIGTLERDI